MLKSKLKIIPDGLPNKGMLFVDHSVNNRSGHLGHAFVEYAPQKILSFYPDCSDIDQKWYGHSGHGWMKYKRSLDGGLTWSESYDEPHSKALYDKDIGRSMMCEKAVCTNSGRIVLFYLQCDMVTDGHIWEPYLEPYYAFSEDGGESFSALKEIHGKPARIWDAIYKDGVIYVLLQDGNYSGRGENPYMLYASEDDGESFYLKSTLPFSSTFDCLYGTMIFRPDGSLLVHIYDVHDEYNTKYLISYDNGLTWTITRRSFFEKRIRNPQITYFNGVYILHGRSGSLGPNEFSGHFILYLSQDGINWNEGTYMIMREAWTGAYSNNLIVHSLDGEEVRVIINTSHAYDKNKTNILQFFIEKN